MHTGPQYTATHPQPGGGGGRGTALLFGGLAFAVVFLLIVGVTVGYLVLRPGGSSGGPIATDTATSTASTTPGETESPTATDTASATPTNVEEERCWSPERFSRTSSNPSGKLRGGGLQFIPPAEYDLRSTPQGTSYSDDVQGAQAIVEEGWASTMYVGAVTWQPGIEYPGAEVASQTITHCFYGANIWGKTKGRSLDDVITEPVTIAGMPGYRTTGIVNFSHAPMESTSATELVVVVLETPQGPSVFATETAVGVEAHEEAADEAYASLTGIS